MRDGAIGLESIAEGTTDGCELLARCGDLPVVSFQ
jgi:hypothetical protein